MLKRIFSGILILIVLVGTVGVSYDSHFCGGKFIKSKVSFVSSSLSCGMKSMKVIISDDTEKFTHICCSNEHMSFELDHDFVKYQTHSPAFIPNFSIPSPVLEDYAFIDETEYSFLGYSPPPLERDVIVLHQSFLI